MNISLLPPFPALKIDPDSCKKNFAIFVKFNHINYVRTALLSNTLRGKYNLDLEGNNLLGVTELFTPNPRFITGRSIETPHISPINLYAASVV